MAPCQATQASLSATATPVAGAQQAAVPVAQAATNSQEASAVGTLRRLRGACWSFQTTPWSR
eukprot:1161530-Pelagomonas_calceolata.AAC.1